MQKIKSHGTPNFVLFVEYALSSYLLTLDENKSNERQKLFWVMAIRALWNGSFHPSNSRMERKKKKCKCNFSSLWVTKSYPHASNEIAFRWHSIMDTKSFLQLPWDWCWTHTGTDVFVWLWVNISIVCHAVTFLLFSAFNSLFFLFSFFFFF